MVNPNETAMVRVFASMSAVWPGPSTEVYNDVSAGRAFDRNFSSRWISQCGPCRPIAETLFRVISPWPLYEITCNLHVHLAAASLLCDMS